MNKANNPFIGTDLKLNIHIDPIGEITMDDYDFEVEMYCSLGKSIIIPKSAAKRVDENNYMVVVETGKIGAGDLKCKVTAHVPDGDFPDQLRTEVACIDTQITIIKKL